MVTEYLITATVITTKKETTFDDKMQISFVLRNLRVICIWQKFFFYDFQLTHTQCDLDMNMFLLCLLPSLVVGIVTFRLFVRLFFFSLFLLSWMIYLFSFSSEFRFINFFWEKENNISQPFIRSVLWICFLALHNIVPAAAVGFLAFNWIQWLNSSNICKWNSFVFSVAKINNDFPDAYVPLHFT